MDLISKANQIIATWQFIATHHYLFPDGINLWGDEFEAYFYGENAKENIGRAIRETRRFYNAEATKDYAESGFSSYIKIPGTILNFRFRTARTNVCTKVIVGTETKEVPDYANAPKITKTVDIIQWECDPILDAS